MKSEKPVIVIIDDEPNLAASLLDFFEAYGWQAFFVNATGLTPRQAAVQALRYNPDVCIVDMQWSDNADLAGIVCYRFLNIRRPQNILQANAHRPILYSGKTPPSTFTGRFFEKGDDPQKLLEMAKGLLPLRQ